MALVKRAEKGDKRALDDVVSRFGDVGGLWRHNGDLAATALDSWLDRAYGQALFSREAGRRRLDRMRRKLSGPAPTPRETLVIERIIVDWLAVQHAESSYSQRLHELTITQCDYQERRLGRAQRRYLDALLTLARLRRLALPALQVNIGERQVNIAGGDTPPKVGSNQG